MKLGEQTIAGRAGNFVWMPRGTVHLFTVTSQLCRALNGYTPAGFEQVIIGLADPAERRKLPPPMGKPDQVEHRAADADLRERVLGRPIGAPASTPMDVEAGVPPMAAIQAATINVARTFHKDKDYGSVEAGKVADLSIIEGDPLRDIWVTQNVKMVVLDGKLVDPKFPEIRQSDSRVQFLAAITRAH